MRFSKTIILLLLCVYSATAQTTTNVIAQFIKDNPSKSAIYLVHNGKTIADINSNRIMPLASTVKIVVAIEYASQIAIGRINPNTLVDTSELHKYYIPNTDGGAQPRWVRLMVKENRFSNGQINLEEIAKGMINFSSNANTEYLLDVLGLDNVNTRLEKLGLKQHDKLYYFISALGVINNKTKAELDKIAISSYIKKSSNVHELLKTNPSYKKSITNLSIEAQKVWSDRLPASTTKDYVSILQKINNRTYFDSTTQKNIDIVLGGLMESPTSKQWLKHGGFKGGSTAFVLTQCIYITTTKDETIEVAYFFNNLSIAESLMLQKHMGQFEFAILTNKDGKRDKVLNIINSK